MNSLCAAKTALLCATPARSEEETEEAACLKLTGKRLAELNPLLAPCITRLDVSGCELSRLPSAVSSLLHLKWVNLSSNQLSMLPAALAACRALTAILARDNRIRGRERPPSWLDLPHTAKQKKGDSTALAHSQEEESTTSIYTQEELEDKQNDNYLRQEEEDKELDLSQLEHLVCLDLSRNQLAEFPRGLSSSTSLTFINLASNNIRTMPPDLACSGVVRHMVLDDNPMDELTCLPGWFCCLRRCSILSVAGCYLGDLLADLPSDYGRSVQRILKLDVRDTRLTSYPMGLTNLLDLEVLLVSHRSNLGNKKLSEVNRNWFMEFPAGLFADLRALERLEASNVGLASLPDALGQLGRLRHLDLSHNTLGRLTDAVGHLKLLEYLDLSNNRLYILPAGIVGLSSLKHLLVSHNQIFELTEGVFHLQQLETLDLYANQIFKLVQEPPSSLLRFDLAANQIARQDLLASHGAEFLERYAAMQKRMRDWQPLEERKGLLECLPEEEWEADPAEDYHKQFETDEDETDHEDEDDEEDCDVDSEEGSEQEAELWEVDVPSSWTETSAERKSWGCWEDSLFCPAKDHPPPINDSILRHWDEELEGRRRAAVGGGRRMAGTDHASRIFIPQQFDDCDGEEPVRL